MLLLTIGVRLYARGLCTYIGADSGVQFDLTPVLAHAAMPVHVRACVRSCVSFTVEKWGSGGLEVCYADSCPPPKPYASDWIRIHASRGEGNWQPSGPLGAVQVIEPTLAWLPVTVRVTMTDQAGNPIFDSSARVQPHMWQPNGPGCEPTVYSAGVVATRTGRLVPEL
jgi:hypothetical protein